MPRKPEEEPKGMERWLLTYADMITLLMLFFIVLYSMSVVDAKKFDKVIESTRMAFFTGLSVFPLKGTSPLPVDTRTNEGIIQPVTVPNKVMNVFMSEYFKRAVSMFQPQIIARKVRVILDERGLIITLGADQYFAPGSADLNQDALQTLQTLTHLLTNIPNKIRVEGNTDNTPIETGTDLSTKFASNWELSSQRAINVVKYLVSLGVPENQLMAVAYAGTKPVETNDSPEGRAYNRRIEIVIIPEGAE